MDYEATLERWQQLKVTIKQLQGEEKALREGLFQGTFTKPKEGTNTFELPDGRKLKGTYKLNRTPIQDRIEELPKALIKEVFLIKYSLVIGPYKKLDAATRRVVDKVLTIKPGLPTLEIKEAE